MYAEDLAYIHDAGFGDFARGVAPELIGLLRRRRSIVEAGCGSGILARALTETGHRVRGFDASPAMIRLARARAPKASFSVATIASARIPPCDAVVAVGEVLTYVRTWRTVERFFRRVHAALPPGGLFVFDFIESGERRTYTPKSRGGEDWAIVAAANLSRDGRTLTRRLTMFRKVGGRYRKSHELHRVRIYPRAHVESALRRLGFDVRMRRSFGRYKLMHGDVAVVARRR